MGRAKRKFRTSIDEEKEIVKEVKRIEDGIRNGKIKTYSKKEFERLAGLTKD